MTELIPFTVFYPAENYHQNYCKRHPDQPYVQHVSRPRIDKLRKAMQGKQKNGV